MNNPRIPRRAESRADSAFYFLVSLVVLAIVLPIAWHLLSPLGGRQ